MYSKITRLTTCSCVPKWTFTADNSLEQVPFSFSCVKGGQNGGFILLQFETLLIHYFWNGKLFDTIVSKNLFDSNPGSRIEILTQSLNRQFARATLNQIYFFKDFLCPTFSRSNVTKPEPNVLNELLNSVQCNARGGVSMV